MADINENNKIAILRIRNNADRDGNLHAWMWTNDTKLIELFNKINVKSSRVRSPGGQGFTTLRAVLDILTGMSYSETRRYQDYELPLGSGPVREQIKVFHKEVIELELVNQMENLNFKGVNVDDDDVE